MAAMPLPLKDKACLDEYETAVSCLRKSIDANRNNPWTYFYLAACLAHLGRLDEAREELKAGLGVNPNFTLRRFRAGVESDNPVFLAQYAHHRRHTHGGRAGGVSDAGFRGDRLPTWA
jgi:tetratricopeptide (TPR) repeat protein